MSLPPYAEMLGLRREFDEEGRSRWTMPFDEVVVGRPGFLHGGAIAGLLEFAALGALHDALGEEGLIVKPINVTVDYLRGGTAHETFASGTVTRLGKRVANVTASAWQRDPAKPIATAQMNLLLKRD